MALELERGDDAEVAAAAAERPQEVRVAIRPGDDLLAGRRDDLGPDQVVAGEPRTPDSQPIPPPRVRSADAGVAECPADDREVMRPAPPRRRPPRGRRPRRGTIRFTGSTRDLAPIAHVDDEGAIGHRMAGDAVPAAADRDRQAEVGGSHDRGDDVVDRSGRGRSPPAAAGPSR